MEPIRLTELSHGAGCACKLPAGDLHALLADLATGAGANVLVGNDTADDAAVYQLSEQVALVTSADFFTPIVDNPYDFGRIAAANALSDIYAMGATPLTALNLVAWPLASLGRTALREVLHGGAAVTRTADTVIVGGHSIDDREPKYGLAVTGVVHPDAILRNSTARAGDSIYLTKPVGGGVVSTAIKRGIASASLRAGAIDAMVTLNRDAAEQARRARATAVTDVTGYGLLGHLHELTKASGIAATVAAEAVPALPGVLDLLAHDHAPIAGGTRRNREWLEPYVSWSTDVPEAQRWLLCDAMTSGGLLVAAPSDSSDPGVLIGKLQLGTPGHIDVE